MLVRLPHLRICVCACMCARMRVRGCVFMCMCAPISKLITLDISLFSFNVECLFIRDQVLVPCIDRKLEWDNLLDDIIQNGPELISLDGFALFLAFLILGWPFWFILLVLFRKVRTHLRVELSVHFFADRLLDYHFDQKLQIFITLATQVVKINLAFVKIICSDNVEQVLHILLVFRFLVGLNEHIKNKMSNYLNYPFSGK